MDQITQKPILKMENNRICVCSQDMVGSGEVNISLISLDPSEGLMFAGVEHHG
jgi:hypothetical protein